jgi:hypothetical protein
MGRAVTEVFDPLAVVGLRFVDGFVDKDSYFL